MVTEIGQTQFNFNVICEGLRAIAATREEQLSLNKEGLTYLDDIFDPMPLEYASWLEEHKEIDPSFASELRALYQEIENAVGGMGWRYQDEYISSNPAELQQLRNVAKRLMGVLKCV